MINARDAAATVARVSFRDTWNAVTPTITTARPSAASGVSHVAMLTVPGRISPSDATTSAHVAIVRLTGMFCSASNAASPDHSLRGDRIGLPIGRDRQTVVVHMLNHSAALHPNA